MNTDSLPDLPLGGGLTGWDTAVICVYLAAMLGMGFWIARRQKSTEDFFIARRSLPAWAVGISIFASLLSTITYLGMPGEMFRTGVAFLTRMLPIPLVLLVVWMLWIPFFMRLNVTSAYEYLERRFSRGVRLFGSASFTFFHIFRMAVIMSLTSLVLAVATPLTPVQSVLLMGVLSISYCTMGGIEAVIWTDTIQAFALCGGMVFLLWLLLGKIDGGWSVFLATGVADQKFNMFRTDGGLAERNVFSACAYGFFVYMGGQLASYGAFQRYVTVDSVNAARKALIIKGGFIAYSLMGDPNASIPTTEPIYYRPMFGALGKAKKTTSVTFTSQLALDNGLEEKLKIEKKLVPVRNCRNIGKKDMVYNDATPKIEIDPETYEVKVDGKIATVDPAKEVSLARLYSLY